MKRRHFLTLAGGGIILAAGSGIARTAFRTPDQALAPWSQAGSAYTEPRKRALSYAILAPNPHNRQPWLVDLSVTDTVVLFADPSRMLPETDPFNRQITIGLGCFLELLVMAAAEEGWRVTVAMFPEGEDASGLDGRPVAVARFERDGNVGSDPLFAHVMIRRSLKEPFDTTRAVPDEALDSVVRAAQHGSQVSASHATQSIDRLRQLTHDALFIEIDTPETYQESVDLFRIGAREVNANPDGIDFTGPAFELMGATGLFTREAAVDRDSTAFQEGFKAVLANTDTAMAHLWQVTPGNSRSEQLLAGRDWLRINLASTAEGLGIQPLSQALQEYSAMQTHYDEVHRLLAPEGGTVQMLARLGYGPELAPSPRWALEKRLIETTT